MPLEEAGTVLLADDDEDIRETIAAALIRRGYSVLLARHGREALALAVTLAARPTPRLILLDLTMHTMDGKQFLAERLADPRVAGIPVVVMSGWAAESLGDAAWMTGANVAGWLAKPVTLAGLLATVATFCTAATPSSGSEVDACAP